MKPRRRPQMKAPAKEGSPEAKQWLGQEMPHQLVDTPEDIMPNNSGGANPFTRLWAWKAIPQSHLWGSTDLLFKQMQNKLIPNWPQVPARNFAGWNTGLTQTFIHLPLVPVLQKEWGIGASCSLTSRPLPVKPGTMIKGWLAAKLSAKKNENCKHRCHNAMAFLFLATSWNLKLTWPIRSKWRAHKF